MGIDSTPMAGGPLLRLSHVDVVRTDRYLLRDISFEVNASEQWAVIGPNGAGKSTLLGLLGARTHPTHGRAEVLGRRMGRVDVRELRTYIGHVDPRHPLQSPLRVHDIVLTGATNTTELIPRWRPTAEQLTLTRQLIELLGLGARRDDPWPILSQGERGRALIARALMPQPRLLLLDEPATGLDLAAREQLVTGLAQLHDDHPDLATVLVTHHLEDMPATISHALLLRDARIVAQGPADDVLTSEAVSRCFDHPITITRTGGRWTARAATPPTRSRLPAGTAATGS